jgi:hypothetical protein
MWDKKGKFDWDGSLDNEKLALKAEFLIALG